jgi:hypothetical protein
MVALSEREVALEEIRLLRAELDAARAVVEAARKHIARCYHCDLGEDAAPCTCLDIDSAALGRAIAAYDAAMKG